MTSASLRTIAALPRRGWPGTVVAGNQLCSLASQVSSFGNGHCGRLASSSSTGWRCRRTSTVGADDESHGIVTAGVVGRSNRSVGGAALPADGRGGGGGGGGGGKGDVGSCRSDGDGGHNSRVDVFARLQAPVRSVRNRHTSARKRDNQAAFPHRRPQERRTTARRRHTPVRSKRGQEGHLR